MKRIVACLLLLLIFSCEKMERSDIPYAPVSFTVDLRFKDKELSGALSAKTFTAPRTSVEVTGYSGILVVHGYDSYYAYELCCPHEAKRNIKVVPTDIGSAKCPECGSEYDTAYGSGAPVSGPSKFPLVRFNVIPSGQDLVIRY